MDDLPVITITSAAEQAELRSILIHMTSGDTLKEACAKLGITPFTARRRMAQYPEVLSEFKKANDALMRGQLLKIIEAKDIAIEKLADSVTVTNDPDVLMRLNDHLTRESERIKAELNTDGSARDGEIKRIMGISRRPISSRMEITINLEGKSTKEDDASPIVIDA